jgi:hypothetical protein
MKDDELTSSERKAFDSLPRESVPDHALEERTVKSLRRRGFLGSRSRSGITLSPVWPALAAAALVLFTLGGFALGHWSGARQTTDAMLAMQEQNGLRLAAEVQRTGTAYITALNTLVENLEGQDPELQAQGRQVAISALYAAADLVVNIAPDEPVAQNIVWALDQSGEMPEEDDGTPPRHYVSF